MAQCNYHRVHGINIPLSHHGKCMYNNDDHFKICIGCKRNNKKTINAKLCKRRKAIKKKSSTQHHTTKSTMSVNSNSDFQLLISIIGYYKNLNISTINITMSRGEYNTIQFNVSSDPHIISIFQRDVANLKILLQI